MNRTIKFLRIFGIAADNGLIALGQIEEIDAFLPDQIGFFLRMRDDAAFINGKGICNRDQVQIDRNVLICGGDILE